MRKAWMLAWIVFVGCAQADAAEPWKHDMVLYRHEDRYSAFPSLTQGPGQQVWVGFGWNTTRSHYGRAAGGQSGGIRLFSPDGGRSWHRSGQDPQYRAPAENLSGLVLSDGAIIRIGPRMHEVLPA